MALILSVVVIGAGSGLAGTFGYLELNHYLTAGGSLKITNFSLSSNMVEQSTIPVSFNIQGSSSGEAGYQVYLTNTTLNVTITSGSFYKSLNYTDSSLGTIFFLGSLSSGSYNIVASVFQGSNIVYRSNVLDVIPPVNITSIKGPTNVSDANGTADVGYTATHISGGLQPFYYNWTITTYYSGNIQNYSETDSNHSSTFTILFYTNLPNGNSYGKSAIYYINLKVTDSLGFSVSTAFPGYMVNVTS